MSITIQQLVEVSHGDARAAGWHDVPREKGTMLALIHSEISEALEGERREKMDEYLPHRPAAEVELADAVIRIADYCGLYGYDLEGAILEKMIFNKQRADHKRDARQAEGGKKF